MKKYLDLARRYPVKTATILYLLLLLALFARTLFLPGLIQGDDPITFYFYAVERFLLDAREAGGLPLWCSARAGGIPYIGSALVDFMHPTFWLYLIMPFEKAYHLGLFLHFWMGAVFMFLYLRRINLSLPASFFGGVALTFSGYYVSDAFHYPVVEPALYLPVLLYMIESGLQTNRIRYYVGFSVFLCLHSFIFFPQVQLYCGFVWGTYLIVRAFQMRKIVELKRLLLATVCGVALMSPVLLQGFANASTSDRASESYEFMTQWSLPPEEVTQFFLRNPFGDWSNFASFVHKPDKPDVYYFGRMPVRYIQEYLGVALFFLCLAGFTLRKEEPIRRYFTAFMLFGILFAFGKYTNLSWIPWYMLLIYWFTMIVLGWAIRVELKDKNNRFRRWFIYALAFGVLLVVFKFHSFYQFLFDYIPSVKLFRGPARINIVLTFAAAVLGAIALDVLYKKSKTAGLESLYGPLKRGAIFAGVLFLLLIGCFVMISGNFQQFFPMAMDYSRIPEADLQNFRSQIVRDEPLQLLQGYLLRKIFQFLIICTTLFFGTYLLIRNRDNKLLKITPIGLACLLICFQLVDTWSVSSRFLKNLPMDDRYTKKDDIIRLFETMKSVPTDRYLHVRTHFQFPDNKGALFGFDTPIGYHSYYPRAHKQLTDAWMARPEILNFLNVRYIISMVPINLPHFKSAYEVLDSNKYLAPQDPSARFPMFIYENTKVLPRVMAYSKSVAMSEMEFNFTVRNEGFPFETTVALDKSARIPQGLNTLGKPEKLVCSKWNARSRSFDINASKNFLLVISENFDRDWIATWQGKKLEILKANTGYQCWLVPPGQGTLELKYRPMMFYIGLWFMGLSIVILSILAWRSIRSRTW
ncbi:MAG: hypothetical protein SGI71_04175 [Verrucomicrobiota bacterium]|nr:hypothetical protein [Verrucomicrobiota bacterium]